MPNLSFQDVFLATLQIMLMGFCGYALVKRRLLGEEGLRVLPRLLINFFLPMLIFDQFTRNFSFESFERWWLFPLLSVGMVLGAFLLSQLILLFFPDLPEKREFNLLVIFQNGGYFQLLLVSALFQGEWMTKMNVYIFLYMSTHAALFWSFGIWWLLGKRYEKTYSLRKVINPPLLTVIVSMLMVYFGLNKFIPETLQSPIGLFADCTLPLAVIVVGGNLACINMKRVRLKPVAGVVLAKLVILPLLMLGIVYNMKVDTMLGIFLILQASAPSAIILPIVAKYYKINEELINQSIFFTYLLSVLTIPVFINWYIHLI